MGACVGVRGVRIQNIVHELDGEKVDVIQWHEDPAVFVANALSPAQVVGVDTGKGEKVATVVVPDRLLSLAIGKDGQNARLAARLTGWKIDIKNASMAKAEEARLAAEAAARAEEAKAAVAEAEAALAQAGPAEEVTAQAPQVEEIPSLGLELVAEEAPLVEAEAPVVEEGFLLPPIPEPVAAGKQQIRFAEEILGPVGVLGAANRKGKKEKGRREKEEGLPKKKVRKARPVLAIEEDYEEYDFRVK